MNIWKEPYPNDLQALLRDTNKLSKLIVEKLQVAPRIKDLYTESGANGKLYRSREIFDLLNTEPNVKYNGSKAMNEIKGIYVLGKKMNGVITPDYVGISDTILRRIKQHGWGTGHNQSSLAYLMAKYNTGYTGSRENLDQEVLKKYQKQVQQHYIVVHSVTEAYDKYFMEVALAGILNTKWNSFKTH